MPEEPESASPEIIYPEIYESVAAAVKDGLAFLKERIDAGYTPEKYYNFPQVSYSSTGLPAFSHSLSDEPSPPDYSRSFDSSTINSIQSWRSFHNLIPTFQPLLSAFQKQRVTGWNELHFPDDGNFRDQIRESSTKIFLAQFVDRYMHVYGNTNFSTEDFKPIYAYWERGSFGDFFPIDIVTPILFLKIEADSYETHTHWSIDRMSEAFQLARNTKISDTTSAHKFVVGAATHVLRLKDWQVSEEMADPGSFALYEFQTYKPAAILIDLFFSAVRIVTGYETGYSQVIADPIGWTNSVHWQAYLPQLIVTSTRAYPDHFEYWRSSRVQPVITAEQLKEIDRVFTALQETKYERLRIAANRLNMAYLRRQEEDTILDIAIALEMLLVEDSNSEITYRLSMRLAAICIKHPYTGYSIDEIYKIVKDIYTYRSSVAHGATKGLDKKRMIQVKSSPDPIPAISIGISLLRHVLNVLADNQHLLDPKELDKILLGISGT